MNSTSVIPVQLTKFTMSGSVTVRPIVLNLRPRWRLRSVVQFQVFPWLALLLMEFYCRTDLATMLRWIWFVPSMICSTFASRKVAIDRILVGDSCSSEQLHGVGCDFHRRIGGEALCNGSQRSKLRAANTAVDRRRRFVGEIAGRGDLDRHVGDHPAHALEIRDRLAKCAPIADELDRMIHRALRQADAASRHDRP